MCVYDMYMKLYIMLGTYNSLVGKFVTNDSFIIYC